MSEKNSIEKIRKEAEEIVKTYMSKDDIGYEDCVYKVMKKMTENFGIEWTPFKNPNIQ